MLLQLVTIVLAGVAVLAAMGQWVATHMGTRAQQGSTLIQQLQALTEAATLALSIRERENADLKVRLHQQDDEIEKLRSQVARLERKVSDLEDKR